MEDIEFLTLSQLFDAIAIIEKGIDKIYHYLLVHKRIENLKDICETFNLSLKRGYKVASVLNDLELVQIYDRPMKIQLSMPIVPIWQKIINSRIQVLRREFEEKRGRCETFFEDFIKKYNLKDEPQPEPVEFLSFNITNIQDMLYVFLQGDEARIALGFRYENSIVATIKQRSSQDLPDEFQKAIREGMTLIKQRGNILDLKVIFSADYLETTLNTVEFDYFTKRFAPFGIKFKNLEARVVKEDFSNFDLTKDELIQPSFDPTNKLIGAYISRNKGIYQIFSDKFNEIFKSGTLINDYLKQDKSLKKDSITELESFILCLL